MKFNIYDVLSPINLYIVAAALSQLETVDVMESVALLFHVSNEIVTSENFIHAVKGFSSSFNHFFIGWLTKEKRFLFP